MIGICTPFKIDNYGTKLQAYAVQEKIRELGYDFEIINFNRRSDLRINKLFAKYANKKYLGSKIHKKRMNLQVKNYNLKIRKDAINSFDRTHYILTKEIKGYGNLKKSANKYDALICGSDQIWLPGSINIPTATLEFGNKNIRKIAFAASFGISSIPKKKINQYRKFLKKIDFISVREDKGAELVKELIKKDVQVVLDPTLTVNRNVWDNLSNEGRKIINDKYIFCYFLGTNPKHREKVYELAKLNGLKVVTLPHFKKYNEMDENLTDIQLYDVTPCDFIRLIREAEYVCTDSFHSTVFSILYHKSFYTFERFNKKDKESANSRIYSLLGSLDLKDRIVTEENDYFITDRDINYENVEDKLKGLRIDTDEYLKEALKGLTKKKNKKITFDKPEQEHCCGCTACASICPNNCITIETEENTGFHYPVLTKPEDCIHCNLCNQVCPNKKQFNVLHFVSNAKYIISSNDDIRKKSASGGVFYHVAKWMIENNGMVCGARYDENFNVKHVIIDKQNEIETLMSSKYSESNLEGIFNKIKEILDNNRKILFAGTPCQVHGLKSFLRKEYENLITIDLLCYGIQSPKAWKKYREFITANNKKIKSINMRDKSKSWQDYSMKVVFDNGEVYTKTKNEDPYLRTYSKGLYIRTSCFECNLKAFPRKSDITIGDFWDIDKIMPKQNDGKGAGILFINTNRGQSIIDEIEKNNEFKIIDIDNEELRKVHPLFGLNSKKSKKSERFYDLLQTNLNFEQIVTKCEMTKIEKKIREINNIRKKR